LMRVREARSKKSLSVLAFSYFASLSIFLSLPLLARSLRLPYLVLMSPYLDWVTWVISGNVFAWICLLGAKSEKKRVVYLGALTLAGSILQVLPTFLPRFGLSPALSWIGSILMPAAVVALTVMFVRNSAELFSVPSLETARLLVKSFFTGLIPLQIWSIATVWSYTSPSTGYPRFDSFLFYERLLELLLPLTTLLFVLLVTEWLWFPAVVKITTRRTVNNNLGLGETLDKERSSSFDWRLLTGFAVLVGVLISSYQWSRGYPLGQDARYYAYVLRSMDSAGFQIAFSTERPFFFLALHVIEKIFGLDLSLLLRLVPIVLASVLTIATYSFTKFVGGKRQVAALAAVFAAVLPHVTVGVDIFIVANWLGILLMMVFLYVFLKSISQRSIPLTLLSIVLSGLTLGMHYFTWLFMMLVLLVYLLLSLIERRFFGVGRIFFSVLAFLGCLAVLVPALFFIYLIGGETIASLELARHMIGLFLSQATPMNFVSFLLSPERIYNYFGREHYAIPMVYALALIGSVRLSSSRTNEARLLRAWLLSCSFGILMVQYDEWWRFLYMVPFEILAAFGLIAMLRYVGSKENLGAFSEKKRVLSTGLQFALFLMLGILLAFSAIPSFVLLLSFGLFALVELLFPFQEGWGEISILLVAFLALEQICRALYALA